jgi:hypothetical protein
MKTAQTLTEDQANLIQELGLAAETVIFKKHGAALPCQITIQNEGEPLKWWISRDEASGKLKLDDEKPRTGKPLRYDGRSDDEIETLDLKKSHRKWRQTGRRPLSDCIETSRYNPEKLDADLRQIGFSDLEAKAIVAQVCDGDTIRKAAKKIGKTKSFVEAAKIQRMVKALRDGKPLSEASEATGASDAARNAATDAQNRWTLPEAMVKARQMVAYLPHAASDPGIGAVELGKLLLPGMSNAEVLAVTIRINPRSLLDPKGGGQLVVALVDLLEAAHFGNFEHRFPNLLPKGNLKLAAVTARKALNLLVVTKQGNPRDYPTHLLAGIVGIMHDALAPLQRAWRAAKDAGVPRAARLKTIRERLRAEVEELVRSMKPTAAQQAYRDGFNAEVEPLTDTELQSWLTNNDQTAEGREKNLLMASARAVEKATGISFKVFVRAWKQEPKLQEMFLHNLHQ